MPEETYKQQIINRFHHPQHKGDHPDPTAEASLANPLCGDNIRWQLHIANGTIQSAIWQGDGCAISLAAADMLADQIVQKTPSQLLNITNPDMIKILGIEVKPSREKCATLALECLKKALAESD